MFIVLIAWTTNREDALPELSLFSHVLVIVGLDMLYKRATSAHLDRHCTERLQGERGPGHPPPTNLRAQSTRTG